MVNVVGSDKGKEKKPKLHSFKKKMSYLRDGGGVAGLRHRGTLEWHLNQDMSISEAEFAVLDLLQETLLKSRTGKAFLDDAYNNGVSIEFDEQIATSQFYPENRLITLNSNHPNMVMMVHMIGELRRSWQSMRDLYINPLNYRPDEAILVNRAQQADTTMMSVRIAWELKLIGENILWDHLLMSSNADIARGFEMQAKNDFRSLNNGDAARKAYDMWFAEERMKFYDKKIIHQMLLDEKTVEEQEKIKNLDGQKLYDFADMPYGKNYLSLSGYRSPIDQDYSFVEDRSNANFLWFIKFERNFQIREHEMMQNTAASPLNIVDFQDWKACHPAE